MRILVLALLATAAGPAFAQSSGPELRPTIQVTGTGKVSIVPDIASIDYWVAGEGKTPDEASTIMAAKQKAVMRGLAGLLAGQTTITGGNVVLIETRSPQCNGPNSYNSQPQLSEGVCAVTGYIATLQGHIRTDAVAKAGTAVGLAARLGARDARLQNFELADYAGAMKAATAKAIADARTQALAIAAAAGTTLGPVVTIRDQNGGIAEDIVVTGARLAAPPAPPPPPPPVEIDVAPRPIDVQAQVYVVYAIGTGTARAH